LARGPRLLEKYLPGPNITETHHRMMMMMIETAFIITARKLANAFAVNISLDR
jgi:hypothetical protein